MAIDISSNIDIITPDMKTPKAMEEKKPKRLTETVSGSG
jgi:hypothetical protein